MLTNIFHSIKKRMNNAKKQNKTKWNKNMQKNLKDLITQEHKHDMNWEKITWTRQKHNQTDILLFYYPNAVNLVYRRANGEVWLSSEHSSELWQILSPLGCRHVVPLVAGIIGKTGRFAPCLNYFKNGPGLKNCKLAFSFFF